MNNEQPKKSGRKRRRNYDDNSDDDFIDDSSSSKTIKQLPINSFTPLDMNYYNRCQSKQEHPQIIYIHGCGTTSLVHALAEEHHFKVGIRRIEMKSSEIFALGYGNQWNSIACSSIADQAIGTSH